MKAYHVVRQQVYFAGKVLNYANGKKLYVLLSVECNKKGKVVPLHAMKPYGGAEEKSYTFLTSVPDGTGGSLNCSDRPEEVCPDTP